MHKYSLILLLTSLLSTSISAQETFKPIKIPEGKCVVYVYRIGGGAAGWAVDVAKANNGKFSAIKKGVYLPYAKLDADTYVPVLLDANTKYRFALTGPGIPVYFEGESGSESVIQVKGKSYPKYDCLKGSASITKKTLINIKFESEFIAGTEKAELFTENNNSKLNKVLMETKLSTSITKKIY